MFWLEHKSATVHPNSAQFGGTQARWKGKSVQHDVNQPQGLLSI